VRDKVLTPRRGAAAAELGRWASPVKVRVVAALISGATLVACGSRPEPPTTMSMALPGHLILAACEMPTERELKTLELAAEAIELDDQRISSSLTIGAKKLLGDGLLRALPQGSVRVCTPEAIMVRVGNALTESKGLGVGRLVEYEYALAAQLPNPSAVVIKQVGDAAFNDNMQSSEIFPREDIRPLARSTLAGFGERASAYRDIATMQMSGDTALGTGAAQVAAATKAPGAARRVVELFREQLLKAPARSAIPLDTRDRLLELAWAIYFSGDPDRTGLAAIKEVMARRVESRAPPFGILEVQPKRFCAVLSRLEGVAGVSRFPFCTDPGVPYEQ